jgi:hypothetical protein
MKTDISTCIAGVMLLSLTANAQARTVRLFRDPPKVIRPLGAPRIVEGPVALGQVFLSQDFTYVRTARLVADLTLPEGDFSKASRLPKGTPFYALDNGADPTWCTIIRAGPVDGCFTRGVSGYFWSYSRKPDLNPLRYLDLITTLKAQGRRNVPLSEAPQLEDTPDANVVETLNISLIRGARYRQNPCGLYFRTVSARTNIFGTDVVSHAEHSLVYVAHNCLGGGVTIEAGEDTGVTLTYAREPQQLTVASIHTGAQ